MCGYEKIAWQETSMSLACFWMTWQASRRLLKIKKRKSWLYDFSFERSSLILFISLFSFTKTLLTKFFYLIIFFYLTCKFRLFYYVIKVWKTLGIKEAYIYLLCYVIVRFEFPQIKVNLWVVRFFFILYPCFNFWSVFVFWEIKLDDKSSFEKFLMVIWCIQILFNA